MPKRKHSKKKEKRHHHDGRKLQTRLWKVERAVHRAEAAEDLEERIRKAVKSGATAVAFERIFHVAVAVGDVGAVEALLRSSPVDVNSIAPSGLTALHAACYLSDGALCALLMRYGETHGTVS